MSKLKVYLDMDGVIANFHSKYLEIKGDHDWCDVKFYQLVEEHRIFSNLDWMPMGEHLAGTLLSWHGAGLIDLEILSSCGSWNVKIAPKSAEQKTHWLNARGFEHIKKNFVHSFVCKKKFAIPDSVIIDDRTDVIEQFQEAGGIGLLYKDEECLTTLKSLVSIIAERNQHANVYFHQ